MRFIEAGTKVAFEDNHAHIAVWDHLGETKASKFPHSGRTLQAMPSDPEIGSPQLPPMSPLKWKRSSREGASGTACATSPLPDLFCPYGASSTAEGGRVRARSPVDAIAFHPGGLEMVTASSDRTLVWPVDTDQPHSHLDGVGGRLVRLAYSDNGNHIFGGSEHADTI